MKRPVQMTIQHWLATAALLALATTLPMLAQAEQLRPAGTYSDAKLERRGEAASQPQEIAEQAKTWVKSQWHSLKSLAGWDSSKNDSLAQSHQVTKKTPREPASASTEKPSLNPDPAKAANGNAAPAARTSSETGSASVATSAPAREDTAPVQGLTESASGVPVYDMSSVDKIPRLNLKKEERFSSSRWGLNANTQKTLNDHIIHQLDTPDLILTKDLKAMTTIGQVDKTHSVPDVVFGPKGKVSRAEFEKIVMKLAPEAKLKLAKYVPLTDDENRFLSGLLLYQGEKCSEAVGIFHKLSKSTDFQSEANYYLAMCSRKLGLESDFVERARRILEAQDVDYSPKILKEVGSEVPYEFTDSFGLALFKASSNAKIMNALDAKTKGNVAYLIAAFGASTERFKTALTWAKQVPKDHPKYTHALFLQALGEYQSGSKADALKIQEDLIATLDVDKTNQEFEALVALNLARMYFQEKKFKEAHVSFLKVYKDHPMWLQSLTELGWAQLMSGDFEGAIGNMYSIHSPFFSGAYKPESYVIRTIGYLNICQYGDAYRTLSLLEHDYRPWLGEMEAFTKNATSQKGAYYHVVRDLLVAQKAAALRKGDTGPKEVDGLPVQVVREMARHRDFTNLQKALNRQLDERPSYDHLESDVGKGLKRAQQLVNLSRKHADTLRKQIASIKKNPQLEQNRVLWQNELAKELEVLNGRFFDVDLYNDAVAAFPDYKKEVIAMADVRIGDMHEHMEKILATRMLRMKVDLARELDNNELLRYEVFAGSGENIRFQVAGGEQSNRIPASVIPKSKSLHWDFDGEYWEDEIGHYRSSLKNNCPANQRREQAQLDGGSK